MFLLFLVACAIEPQEGRYIVDVGDVTADAGCDAWEVDLDALRQTGFTDVTLSEDGESMALDDTVECDRFGNDFECVMTDEQRVAGADAAVLTTHEIEGAWTTSFTFEADWRILVECQGVDCGGIEPCKIAMSWEAALE